MSDEMEQYVELTRVGDTIAADLLAAFLEDGEITFKLVKSAQTMAPILQSSAAPIVFWVLESDLEEGKELLAAYKDALASQSDDTENESDDDGDDD